MAKLPPTRLPNSAEQPSTALAGIAPAPNNGVPFTQAAHSATVGPIKRRGKQLGARIPAELHDRLVACSAHTRIPQGRLLERALNAELKSHGF